MEKRAMLVARVSTIVQKDNYSPDTQLAGMGDYARCNGFTDLIEVKDVCSGTIPIRERPGGQQLYRAIQDRSIGAVIFYTFDRASRDEYAIDFMILQRDLAAAGIELHITDRGKIGNDSFSLLMAFFGIAQAGDERKKIAERTARGKRAKAAEGKYVGVGAAPYGYRREGLKKDTRLVIDEIEARVVQRIFDLYTIGENGKTLSVQKIAERMSAEGHIPPGGNMGPGRGWWCTVINRILTREIYIGRLSYAGHVTEIPELAIIDRAQWEEAQRRRAVNKKNSKRNAKGEYLLSGGRVRCVCGGSMVGTTTHPDKSPYPHYKCCRSVAKDKHLYSCREGSVSGKFADTKVWEWINGLISDDGKLAEGLRTLAEQSALRISPKRERLAALNGLTEAAEKKIRRLVALYGDSVEKELAALKSEVRALNGQCETWAAECERLTAELTQLELTEEKQSEICKGIRCFRGRFGGADFAERRTIIEDFDVQAQLRRDESGGRWLDCTCAVPGWITSIDLHVC